MDAIDLSQFRRKPEGQTTFIESMNKSDNHKAIIENAISLNGFGDKISYDWSMTVAPSSSGQVMPVYILVMEMPTLVLGEVAQSFAMMQVVGLDQAQLEEIVKNSIEEMRAQRSTNLT